MFVTKQMNFNDKKKKCFVPATEPFKKNVYQKIPLS